MKYSGHMKLLCELSKLSFNAFNPFVYLTNTDASIPVYKFRPEIIGFNMYATAINFPCIITFQKYIFLKKNLRNNFFNFPKS